LATYLKQNEKMIRIRIYWGLKLLITVFILAVLVKTIKFSEVLSALSKAEKGGMAAALSLLPLNLALQTVKWGILLKTLKRPIKAVDIFASLLVGFSLGLVTPGRLGEFGRAFAVKGAQPIQVAGLSVVDKFYNLVCIAIIGGIGILTLPGMILQQAVPMIISAVIVYLAGSFAAFFLALHPGFIRGVIYSISLILPKREKMKALIECFDGITRQKAAVIMIISMLFYATFILQFFILVNSFGDLKIIDGIRGLPAIIFAKTFLPVSVGGLGVGELASVRLLEIFNLEAAAAFNASLTLFTINVLTPGILGLFFIPKLKFKPQKTAIKDAHQL